jgi:hypothetical protein
MSSCSILRTPLPESGYIKQNTIATNELGKSKRVSGRIFYEARKNPYLIPEFFSVLLFTQPNINCIPNKESTTLYSLLSKEF